MKLKPFKKDGAGYGNIDMANQHESDKETPIRHGRQGKDEKGETYIGLPARNGRKMTLNKIQHTKVGDDIHFYVNGVENRGIVVKMGGTYVSVFKEDGNVHDIPINETFFVKDILVNKTWDNMSDEERVGILQQVRAYSPRFVQKNWDDLPRELKTVLSEKSDGFKKLKPVYEGDTEQAEKATGMEQNHDKDNLEVEDANHAQTGYAQTQQNTIGKTEALDAPPVEAEHRQDKNPTRGRHPKKSIDDSLKSILQLKSDVEHGVYGSVGGNRAGVSTDTPLDVSADTGYEERPHVSLEEVGEYPRADSKEHHANEVKETGKKQKIEPHEVKQDKKKQLNKGEDGQTGAINTSEGGAFNPVYNAYDTPITPEETATGRKIAGRDQLKKGVPLSNVGTWGLQYVTKEDKEDEEDDPVVESLRTGLHGKYMYDGKHIGDIKHLNPETWRAHVTLHSMPDMGEYGLLDGEASVVTADGKTHKDPRKLTSGGKFSETAMQQERGEGTTGEPDATPAAPKDNKPAQVKTWDEDIDSDVKEESKA